MMSNALQVFSPSFRNVHVSGRSRSSVLRAAGVRVRSEMVFCKLCCIVLLNSWRRFSRDCDCIGSAWQASAVEESKSKAPHAETAYGHPRKESGSKIKSLSHPPSRIEGEHRRVTD